jgi:hypothetical protein
VQYLVITDTDLQNTLPADDVVYQIIHAAPKGPPVLISSPRRRLESPRLLSSAS